MKMKTLIRQAYEIISEEHANVYDEFKEDDGTITPANHAAAVALQTRMGNWLLAAQRVIDIPKAKVRKPAPRGAVDKKARKIVVVGKGSALE